MAPVYAWQTAGRPAVVEPTQVVLGLGKGARQKEPAMNTDPNVRTPAPRPQGPSQPPQQVPAPDVKRMSDNAPSKNKKPDDWD